MAKRSVSPTPASVLDGYHHGLLVLSRWPKVSFPGIIHRLTNLPLLDYTITVNVDPLSVRKEITREEKAHDRLAGDYASEKKLSLVTAMEKKQRKIAALMQGHTLPFNVHFVVRAWDRTKDGLAAKLGAIKNAIHGMNGAQYFECTLPTTSKTRLLPDVARLDVEPLRASETVWREPLRRRPAADQRDLHRPSRDRRSHLRRTDAQPHRRENILRHR